MENAQRTVGVSKKVVGGTTKAHNNVVGRTSKAKMKVVGGTAKAGKKGRLGTGGEAQKTIDEGLTKAMRKVKIDGGSGSVRKAAGKGISNDFIDDELTEAVGTIKKVRVDAGLGCVRKYWKGPLDPIDYETGDEEGGPTWKYLTYFELPPMARASDPWGFKYSSVGRMMPGPTPPPPCPPPPRGLNKVDINIINRGRELAAELEHEYKLLWHKLLQENKGNQEEKKEKPEERGEQEEMYLGD